MLRSSRRPPCKSPWPSGRRGPWWGVAKNTGGKEKSPSPYPMRTLTFAWLEISQPALLHFLVFLAFEGASFAFDFLLSAGPSSSDPSESPPLLLLMFPLRILPDICVITLRLPESSMNSSVTASTFASPGFEKSTTIRVAQGRRVARYCCPLMSTVSLRSCTSTRPTTPVSF